jgi:cytochrome P450
MATSHTTVPVLDGFDPLSDEFLRDPYPILERARRQQPVFYYEPLDFWVVTRYDDIVAILADYRTYSSRSMGILPPPPELADRVGPNLFADAFIGIDPPEHTVSRKNANKWFTRGQVAAMVDVVRGLAHDLIDGFVDDGRCDLVGDYCHPLTLSVIVRMLGLPTEDMPRFRQWTEDLFAVMSPTASDSDEQRPTKPMPDGERHERWTRLAEATAYYGAIVEERRRRPTDDLISAMVAVKGPDGDPALSERRITMHINEMIAAGNDTTANLMAHMVMFFSEDPATLAEVRRDPALMENAVEEGLRRRGSAPGHFRITTRDVEVAGTPIPKGSLLWLVYISAGHDEQHFPSPRAFDVHRDNADHHLAFGRGRHMCMGAPLARLMARVGLDALYERIPELRMVPDQRLDYLPNLTVLTLKRLEVAWA